MSPSYWRQCEKDIFPMIMEKMMKAKKEQWGNNVLQEKNIKNTVVL